MNGIGELLIRGLEYLAEGCGREEGGYLRAEVVVDDPAVDSTALDALDDLYLVLDYLVDEFGNELGALDGALDRGCSWPC